MDISSTCRRGCAPVIALPRAALKERLRARSLAAGAACAAACTVCAVMAACAVAVLGALYGGHGDAVMLLVMATLAPSVLLTVGSAAGALACAAMARRARHGLRAMQAGAHAAPWEAFSPRRPGGARASPRAHAAGRPDSAT